MVGRDAEGDDFARFGRRVGFSDWILNGFFAKMRRA